ncbi:MAG: SsrA-binding protein SmpB [Proteobacteria bacterium]|nr:SsrA-binding protein SmpB [Pseudomonadota bacterium]MDA1058922.1 SsrA-binding protein SmpB [Pseudomonadota bacterium]
MAAKPPRVGHTVAVNRKARRDYHIEDTLEVGIILTGSEVKSLRAGGGSIAEAYAAEREGGLWLVNAHIPEFKAANRNNHEPTRPRKLLLHKKQLEKYLGEVRRGGMTIIPLKIYFNPRGIAKLELALGQGKKNYDKRADIKARDWKLSQARLLRGRG